MKRKAREEVLRHAVEGGLLDDLLERPPGTSDPSPADAEREVAARVRALFGDRDPRSPLKSGPLLLRRLADLMVEQGRPFGTIESGGFRGFPPLTTATWVRDHVRWPSEVEAERKRERDEKREKRRRNAR